MKKRWTLTLAVLLLAGAMVMNSCGGGGGGNGNGGGGGGQATNDTEAAKATSSTSETTAVTDSAQNALDGMSGIGLSALAYVAPKVRVPETGRKKDPGLEKIAAISRKIAGSQTVGRASAGLRKAMAAGGMAPVVVSETFPCGIDGDVTVTGTADDVAQTYSLSFDFNLCQETSDGITVEELDGVLDLTATFGQDGSTTLTIGFGDGGALIYKDGASETVTFALTLDYVISYPNYPDMSTMQFDYSANGTATYRDESTGEVFTMAFTNLTHTFSFVDALSVDNTWVFSYGMDGAFRSGYSVGSLQVASFTMTFTNFTFVWTFVYDDALGSNLIAFREAIDGTFVVALSPSDLCFEGTFTVTTEVPIELDLVTFEYTQGRVKINNVTVEYGPLGVTVTIDGGTPRTYLDLDDVGLEAQCVWEYL